MSPIRKYWNAMFFATIFGIGIALFGLWKLSGIEYYDPANPESGCMVIGPTDFVWYGKATPAYRENCESCHPLSQRMVNDSSVVLENVVERMPSLMYMRPFFRNEDSLLAMEDPYCLEIRAEYSERGYEPHTHNYSTLTWTETEEIMQLLTGYSELSDEYLFEY